VKLAAFRSSSVVASSLPGLCSEAVFPVKVRSLVEDELRRLDLVDDEPGL
jgi:hypothetical protein